MSDFPNGTPPGQNPLYAPSPTGVDKKFDPSAAQQVGDDEELMKAKEEQAEEAFQAPEPKPSEDVEFSLEETNPQLAEQQRIDEEQNQRVASVGDSSNPRRVDYTQQSDE